MRSAVQQLPKSYGYKDIAQNAEYLCSLHNELHIGKIHNPPYHPQLPMLLSTKTFSFPNIGKLTGFLIFENYLISSYKLHH